MFRGNKGSIMLKMNTSYEELKRLSFGVSEVQTEGFIVEILVTCDGNASEVLQKTKEVVKRIIDCELSFEDSVDDWKSILPNWFVEACSPEITKEEAEKLLETSRGFEALANRWTVSGFIYWFRPEEKSWHWWEGKIKDSNTLIVQILVSEFPFAWGSLGFLLRAAGADDVEEL